MGSHWRTSMSRPHVTRVSRTEAGRSREMDNRGNRSGRERSSPTWGHGCRGVTGRRKSVDLVRGYESPPLEFPLAFIQNIVKEYSFLITRQSYGSSVDYLLVFFFIHISNVGPDVVSSKARHHSQNCWKPENLHISINRLIFHSFTTEHG